MEVLHGNQASSKQSRRHSDRYSLAENRLLDWASQHSDIALLPRSPLMLEKVLASDGGALSLIPNDTTSSDDVDAASSQNNTHSGEHLDYLLTQHSNSELLRQCKNILVENALIKIKGERQLYLAAGFISWPAVGTSKTASEKNLRQRAPVLLFPAILVRVTDEQRYEIRLTGDTPEFNSALQQHLELRYDYRLPQFNSESSLTSFFAQVAESIQEAVSLEIELSTALGSAAVASNPNLSKTVQLPEIPEGFNTNLAMGITGNKRLEHLTAVLQLIPDFKYSIEPEAAKDETSHTQATNTAAWLRRYAAKLAAEGLDHVEFKQLPGLPALIKKWNDQMTQATNSDTLQSILSMPDLSARELIKLGGIIELIDKAPDNIESRAHGNLCFSSSTILLRRAQHQAKLIEEELTALQEYFHLDKVPSKSQLLSLITELSGMPVVNDPDLIDASYFNARRQFLVFSKEKPNNLTLEHRRNLSHLAKVMRFRELFVNNVEYRAALGRDYKGLRTDWPALMQTSDYSRELAEVLGSEGMASNIINHWTAFRDSFVRDLETLQQAADATRRLLSIVGQRWQTHSLSALSAHASIVADRLAAWNKHYGSVKSYEDKSAAIVLSSFSGPYMDHVLIETQVDETQSQIRQQLADGEVTLEQVNNTLAWLSSASATASEHNLGIDAIVEHLQLA